MERPACQHCHKVSYHTAYGECANCKPCVRCLHIHTGYFDECNKCNELNRGPDQPADWKLHASNCIKPPRTALAETPATTSREDPSCAREEKGDLLCGACLTATVPRHKCKRADWTCKSCRTPVATVYKCAECGYYGTSRDCTFCWLHNRKFGCSCGYTNCDCLRPRPNATKQDELRKLFTRQR
jgi:hypothetical protein